MIDAAIGEASDLRYRSAVLQRAVAGLMQTISAWRKVAFAIALNGDAATPRKPARSTTYSAGAAFARCKRFDQEARGVARRVLRFGAIADPLRRRNADAEAAGG